MSSRRLLVLAIVGQLMMALVAIRHEFIDGSGVHLYFHWLLNGLEVVGLTAAVMLSGIALGRVLRQASSLDLGFLVRTGLILTLIATLTPPFLSSDIWDYLARGRLDLLGYNPYTETLEARGSNPELSPYLAKARWPEWVMPYGPITAWLQELTARFDSLWTAAYAWKLMMAAAHVATALLILLTLRIVAGEREARRGLVLWLWNPWLLLESCGSGHNDALLAMLLALSGYGLSRARYGIGTGCYGLAILVKHGSAPILPVLMAMAFHQRRLRGLAIGSAAAAVVAAIAYWQYWNVDGGFSWIIKQNGVAQASVSKLLEKLTSESFGLVVRLLGALATLWVLAVACKRARDTQSGARLAILAMVVWVLLFVPNFSPWYQLWWLPLFALANLPVLSRVLELLAWTGPLSYLVLAGTHGFGTLHEVWQLLLAGIWPSLLVLLDWRSFVGKPPKTT